MKQNKKPPLGVVPEYIWKRKRLTELLGAIEAYETDGFVPLPEWSTEVKKLRREITCSERMFSKMFEKYENSTWEPHIIEISPFLSAVYFATKFGPLKKISMKLILKKLDRMEKASFHYAEMLRKGSVHNDGYLRSLKDWFFQS